MLRALGIDVDAVIRTEPLVRRDMERVCVSCTRKAQRKNDIEIGVVARDYVDFCVNAPTKRALMEGHDLARLGGDDRASTPITTLGKIS